MGRRATPLGTTSRFIYKQMEFPSQVLLQKFCLFKSNVEATIHSICIFPKLLAFLAFKLATGVAATSRALNVRVEHDVGATCPEVSGPTELIILCILFMSRVFTPTEICDLYLGLK